MPSDTPSRPEDCQRPSIFRPRIDITLLCSPEEAQDTAHAIAALPWVSQCSYIRPTLDGRGYRPLRALPQADPGRSQGRQLDEVQSVVAEYRQMLEGLEWEQYFDGTANWRQGQAERWYVHLPLPPFDTGKLPRLRDYLWNHVAIRYVNLRQSEEVNVFEIYPPPLSSQDRAARAGLLSQYRQAFRSALLLLQPTATACIEALYCEPMEGGDAVHH